MDLMAIRRGLMAQMASGASLPSFINKLDGGKLALEQNASNATVQINHNLGEIPKGIVLYRNTGDVTAASSEAGIICCVWIYNPTASTGAWIPNSIIYASAVENIASLAVQSNVTAGIRSITNEKFDVYASSGKPLLSDEDYYWLAWA